mmetsp:Transcript_13023/g.30426  ORF Transcript_13023/g.30426 Transcript_13023/m.30426 type:complete len:298 (-) Transcript_13023:652-1545(-)
MILKHVHEQPKLLLRQRLPTAMLAEDHLDMFLRSPPILEGLVSQAEAMLLMLRLLRHHGLAASRRGGGAARATRSESLSLPLPLRCQRSRRRHHRATQSCGHHRSRGGTSLLSSASYCVSVGSGGEGTQEALLCRRLCPRKYPDPHLDINTICQQQQLVLLKCPQPSIVERMDFASIPHRVNHQVAVSQRIDATSAQVLHKGLYILAGGFTVQKPRRDGLVGEAHFLHRQGPLFGDACAAQLLGEAPRPVCPSLAPLTLQRGAELWEVLPALHLQLPAQLRHTVLLASRAACVVEGA